MESVLQAGLETEILVLFLVMIPVVYITGIIIRNTYITFTPKDAGSLMVMMFMLGFILPWVILGYVTVLLMILVALLGIIVYNLFRGHRKTKNKKAAIQKQVRS